MDKHKRFNISKGGNRSDNRYDKFGYGRKEEKDQRENADNRSFKSHGTSYYNDDLLFDRSGSRHELEEREYNNRPESSRRIHRNKESDLNMFEDREYHNRRESSRRSHRNKDSDLNMFEDREYHNRQESSSRSQRNKDSNLDTFEDREYHNRQESSSRSQRDSDLDTFEDREYYNREESSIRSQRNKDSDSDIFEDREYHNRHENSSRSQRNKDSDSDIFEDREYRNRQGNGRRSQRNNDSDSDMFEDKDYHYRQESNRRSHRNMNLDLDTFEDREYHNRQESSRRSHKNKDSDSDMFEDNIDCVVHEQYIDVQESSKSVKSYVVEENNDELLGEIYPPKYNTQQIKPNIIPFKIKKHRVELYDKDDLKVEKHKQEKESHLYTPNDELFQTERSFVDTGNDLKHSEIRIPNPLKSDDKICISSPLKNDDKICITSPLKNDDKICISSPLKNDDKILISSPLKNDDCNVNLESIILLDDDSDSKQNSAAPSSNIQYRPSNLETTLRDQSNSVTSYNTINSYSMPPPPEHFLPRTNTQSNMMPFFQNTFNPLKPYGPPPMKAMRVLPVRASYGVNPYMNNPPIHPPVYSHNMNYPNTFQNMNTMQFPSNAHPPNMMANHPPEMQSKWDPHSTIIQPQMEMDCQSERTSTYRLEQPQWNEDKVDKEDAIQEELKQQNKSLAIQRAEYYKKCTDLYEKLDILKKDKRSIFGNKKSFQTDLLLKENSSAQAEVQNKLKAVKNVIDMLTKIIGDDDKLDNNRVSGDKPEMIHKPRSRYKKLRSSSRSGSSSSHSRSRSRSHSAGNSKRREKDSKERYKTWERDSKERYKTWERDSKERYKKFRSSSRSRSRSRSRSTGNSKTRERDSKDRYKKFCSSSHSRSRSGSHSIGNSKTRERDSKERNVDHDLTNTKESSEKSQNVGKPCNTVQQTFCDLKNIKVPEIDGNDLQKASGSSAEFKVQQDSSSSDQLISKCVFDVKDVIDKHPHKKYGFACSDNTNAKTLLNKSEELSTIASSPICTIISSSSASTLPMASSPISTIISSSPSTKSTVGPTLVSQLKELSTPSKFVISNPSTTVLSEKLDKVVPPAKSKLPCGKESPVKVPVKGNTCARKMEEKNYVYYDPEIHWCRVCNEFPKTAKEYLLHLHTESHKDKLKKLNLVDLPWHKNQPEKPKAPNPNAPTERVPIRGMQFFISVTAWYCKLCDEWIGDLHCASLHLKSELHRTKFQVHNEGNTFWEIDWLGSRMKAYENYLIEKNAEKLEQKLDKMITDVSGNKTDDKSSDNIDLKKLIMEECRGEKPKGDEDLETDKKIDTLDNKRNKVGDKIDKKQIKVEYKGEKRRSEGDLETDKKMDLPDNKRNKTDHKSGDKIDLKKPIKVEYKGEKRKDEEDLKTEKKIDLHDNKRNKLKIDLLDNRRNKPEEKRFDKLEDKKSGVKNKSEKGHEIKEKECKKYKVDENDEMKQPKKELSLHKKYKLNDNRTDPQKYDNDRKKEPTYKETPSKIEIRFLSKNKLSSDKEVPTKEKSSASKESPKDIFEDSLDSTADKIIEEWMQPKSGDDDFSDLKSKLKMQEATKRVKQILEEREKRRYKEERRLHKWDSDNDEMVNISSSPPPPRVNINKNKSATVSATVKKKTSNEKSQDENKNSAEEIEETKDNSDNNEPDAIEDLSNKEKSSNLTSKIKFPFIGKMPFVKGAKKLKVADKIIIKDILSATLTSSTNEQISKQNEEAGKKVDSSKHAVTVEYEERKKDFQETLSMLFPQSNAANAPQANDKPNEKTQGTIICTKTKDMMNICSTDNVHSIYDEANLWNASSQPSALSYPMSKNSDQYCAVSSRYDLSHYHGEEQMPVYNNNTNMDYFHSVIPSYEVQSVSSTPLVSKTSHYPPTLFITPPPPPPPVIPPQKDIVEENLKLQESTLTDAEEKKKKKNPMSQRKRKRLQRIKEKLAEQEKQLEQQIDDTKKKLLTSTTVSPPVLPIVDTNDSKNITESATCHVENEEMVLENDNEDNESMDICTEPNEDDMELALLGIDADDSVFTIF